MFGKLLYFDLFQLITDYTGDNDEVLLFISDWEYVHTSPQDATQMLLLFSCNPKNNSNHPEACLDFKFYYDSSLDWKIDFPKLKPLSIPHFSFHQLSAESVLRVLSFDWKTMPINHSVSWQNRCRGQTDRKIIITIRDSISVFCVQDFRGRDLAWYIACVVVVCVATCEGWRSDLSECSIVFRETIIFIIITERLHSVTGSDLLAGN